MGQEQSGDQIAGLRADSAFGMIAGMDHVCSDENPRRDSRRESTGFSLIFHSNTFYSGLSE